MKLYFLPWNNELLALKAEHATGQLSLLFLTRESIYRKNANTKKEGEVDGMGTKFLLIT